MSYWLPLIDGVAVSIFGYVLSASFCDVLNSRKKRLVFFLSSAALLLIQGVICFFWDIELLRKIYPIVTHLPLTLILYAMTSRLLWSTISVFFAYLACQLRRWISLFVVAFVSDIPYMQSAVQLIVTLPLILILLRFVSPSIRNLSQQPTKLQLQFAIIPVLYYIFDYFNIIFSDSIIRDNPVVVEFMSFVCCLAYLVFLVYNSIQVQKRVELQQSKKILDVQVSQSLREINTLRESQRLARQYRHDLRHHLQYLLICIENGRINQAQRYISDIYQEIDAQKLERYCDNEAVNLILSSFVGRAKKHSVDMNIHGILPAEIKVSDNDLCVLLSNALENALHACMNIKGENEQRTIDVRFYERDDKIFIQVSNTCKENVLFKDGIPISARPEHGIGVQSICAIAQRYDGLCTFIVQDEQFILRVSL